MKVFCQQVSEGQYRAQTSVTSHYEISQLLDSIVSDENMSSKTRKRRLKQVTLPNPISPPPSSVLLATDKLDLNHMCRVRNRSTSSIELGS